MRPGEQPRHVIAVSRCVVAQMTMARWQPSELLSSVVSASAVRFAPAKLMKQQRPAVRRCTSLQLPSVCHPAALHSSQSVLRGLGDRGSLDSDMQAMSDKFARTSVKGAPGL